MSNFIAFANQPSDASRNTVNSTQKTWGAKNTPNKSSQSGSERSMCCVDIGNWWLNPILNAFASFSFWLVFRTSPDNYHIKMHVGVCAVVEKDKLARVRGGGGSQPEVYQSALNCFIITKMHRHNFPSKNNAKFHFSPLS